MVKNCQSFVYVNIECPLSQNAYKTQKIVWYSYFSFQYHPIPVNAIPCLNYKKALEAEEEAIKEREKNAGSIFPVAKVESAEENLKRVSLTPDQYREYCQKLFVFKAHTVKKFKSWSERRTHQRQVCQIL